MRYQEYFDSLNAVLSDLHDDSISVKDATTKINELNHAAVKSGNLVLVKFLANPEDQVKRVLDARAFEAKQTAQEVQTNSYDTGYVDETSYEEPESEDSYSYSYDDE